ncbi:MAG: cation:proton antiporter [Deltaproteobacteria bacterium]|jgi:CPA2 family monovalent cation:H+ antiporter-2|nr:cation:proton antiporter [Deltaproteobacteria bacterium]
MSHPEVLILSVLPLLILAVLIIFLSLKLKLPPIVGFLIVGVLVGPSGFGLITDPHQVEGLSELGVVLLLFTIGLEFSFQEFSKLKRIILLGGSLQMGICVAVVMPLTYVLTGYGWNTSFLAGCLAALSSTAIVLKLLQDKGEMDSAHGRGSLGVLIFQDIAVVPLILILPLLAGQSGSSPVYAVFLKIALIILFVLAANKLVPRIMKKVAETRSTELFMFTVILICLGTAALTNAASLSLALGAFLAGLIIASSPYATLAISSVLPMRDIFTSFFFVSIGLRMDIGYLLTNPFLTIAITAGIMILNVGTIFAAMRLAGLSPRVAVMIGFSLCQIGEFAFVLAASAFGLGLLDDNAMKMFLNVAVLTMALTPLGITLGRVVSPRFADLMTAGGAEPEGKHFENHAVVVGFGVAGQAVARACDELGKPYVVIDMNPASVSRFNALGVPLRFGDAASEHVLEHMGIKKALVLVITIPDPEATRRIIAAARKLNPDLKILARTRFLLNIKLLKTLGADEVIAEEYEAALAVFNSMLMFFGADAEWRRAQIALARQSGPDEFWSAPVVSPKAMADLGLGKEELVDHVSEHCALGDASCVVPGTGKESGFADFDAENPAPDDPSAAVADPKAPAA